MTDQQEDNKLLQQQDLFSRIATRYDLVNHLMTGWQDNRWRRFAVKKLGLPFQEGIFDGVISGFLIRNLGDIMVGLKNQYRILKTGGRIAILDTTKPPNHFLAPIIRFYMTNIIPIIGGIFTGNKKAYGYLNKSTQGFLRAEELAAYLAAAGFKKVAYQQFAFGMITVHWGEK